MTPRLLIKLAKTTKKPQGPIQKRFAGPLAILKATQLGLPQNSILYDSMQNIMNRITTDLITGKISTTKQASKNVMDPTGAVNDFAQRHTISPQDDEELKRLKALNSPFCLGLGPQGACDAMALARSIVDPNVIKGLGENVLSMNKFQNIFNIKNIGSMGRSGGTRLA